jgi:hypothetical protein
VTVELSVQEGQEARVRCADCKHYKPRVFRGLTNTWGLCGVQSSKSISDPGKIRECYGWEASMGFMKKLRDNLENRRGGTPDDLMKPFVDRVQGQLARQMGESLEDAALEVIANAALSAKLAQLNTEVEVEVADDIKDMLPGKMIRVKPTEAIEAGATEAGAKAITASEIKRDTWYWTPGRETVEVGSAQEIQARMETQMKLENARAKAEAEANERFKQGLSPAKLDFPEQESGLIILLQGTIKLWVEQYRQPPDYINIKPEEFRMLEAMVCRQTGRPLRTIPNGTEQFEGVPIRVVEKFSQRVPPKKTCGNCLHGGRDGCSKYLEPGLNCGGWNMNAALERETRKEWGISEYTKETSISARQMGKSEALRQAQEVRETQARAAPPSAASDMATMIQAVQAGIMSKTQMEKLLKSQMGTTIDSTIMDLINGPPPTPFRPDLFENPKKRKAPVVSDEPQTVEEQVLGAKGRKIDWK